MPSSENKPDANKLSASGNGPNKKLNSTKLEIKGISKSHPSENKKVLNSSSSPSANKKVVTSTNSSKSVSTKPSSSTKASSKSNLQKKKKTFVNSGQNKSFKRISAKSSAKVASKRTSPKQPTSSEKRKRSNGLETKPKKKVKAETKLVNGCKESRAWTCENKQVTSVAKARLVKQLTKVSVGDKGFSLCRTCTACTSLKTCVKDISKKCSKDELCAGAKLNAVKAEVPDNKQVEKSAKLRKNKNSIKTVKKERQIRSELCSKTNANRVVRFASKSSIFIHKSVPKNFVVKNSVQTLKNMLGYWKGTRLKRVASLNALAKVHILYENEIRGPLDAEKDEGLSSNYSESPCHDNNTKTVAVRKSTSKTGQKLDQQNMDTATTKVDQPKPKQPRKNKWANAPREIITCRRMASLNAQAILAASYSPVRPRKIKIDVESDSAKQQADTTEQVAGKATQSPGKKKVLVAKKKNKNSATSVKCLNKSSKKMLKSPTSNASKPRLKKQPSKAKSKVDNLGKGDKIETIVGKVERDRTEKVEDTAEVTITGVYINPTTNASICISRVQTYKQSQTYSPPPSPPPSQGQASVHLPATSHVMGGVLHSGNHLSTGIYPFPNTVMPSSSTQTYPMNGLNNIGNMPVVNVALPRHYSSAFTVPHYGHGPITYTHGYYQPAGPLIQTITDPCLIHKPVPYHPHIHQASGTIFPQERCQSHPTSPQTLPFPHDQCPSHPTPPYSSQPCPPTKCPTGQAAAPPPSHFNQDGCHSHSSPQEGFFPDHCSGQAVGTQPYHMSSSFQSSSPNFKTQISSCCSDKNDSCIQAPTLHIQPKTEQVLPLEENPLQPPVLTPVKPLTAVMNFSEQVHESKVKEGICESHSTTKSCDKKVDTAKRRNDGENPARKRIRVNSVDNVEIRQASGLKKLPDNRKSESLPCKRRCMKLLRSNVKNLKSQRLNGNLNSIVRKNSLLLCKKTKQSLSQVKCLSGAATVKRNKVGMRDVTNERFCDSIQVRIVDHVLPKRRPLVGSKALEAKSASTNITSSVIPRGIGRAKFPKRLPRFSNGWTWDGEAFEQQFQLHNDDPPVSRKCYPAMRHIEGDIIKCRDCVLLKSGPRRNDLPFVAKIAGLWENPEDGEMMLSLLWYYRPEHTDQGRKPHHMEDEIFASKHKDVNSVACIEDKCYVLTYNEYCRYRRRVRLLEEGLRSQVPIVPDPEEGYSRKDRQPPGCVSPDMVFFCRKVYDFRQKRILKNPS